MQCRFYRNIFPEVDDLVIIRYQDTCDGYVNVALPEYGDLEGMIQFSELTKSKYRNHVNKIIKLDHEDVAQVVALDEEKKLIDLSRKHLKPNERQEYFDLYIKNKYAHQAIKNMAKKVETDVEKLCQSIFWNLEDEFDSLFDAFHQAFFDFDQIFGNFEIEPDIKITIREIIHQKFEPESVQIRADLEIKSLAGISSIKTLLLEIMNQYSEIEVIYNGAPIYSFSFKTREPEKGFNLMNQIVDSLKQKIDPQVIYVAVKNIYKI